MQEVEWEDGQARAYLGAMKSVALAGGRSGLSGIEKEMLDATATHILHLDIDVALIETILPADLATVLPDPPQRSQAIQFLILMPYLDGVIDQEEVSMVDAFAEALGVDPVTLTALHQVRDKRMRRLQFDYVRRSFATDLTPGDSVLEKLRSTFQAIHQYRGDPKVAEQYHRYESYPAGSLGKVFFDFYRGRKFPLPGEKESFSEFVVPHDLTHILGGCNTDMRGEIDVAGMEAGMSNTPFGYELLLEVILDFHMGLAFTTAGLLEPGTGNFHPETVMQGFERGKKMNCDLLSDWDWRSAMDRQVKDLRADLGIQGVDIIELPPPTEQST